ncbi:MAG: lipase/acyltransferase domain-containing protein [Pyrinomonadaceae bacterium]
MKTVSRLGFGALLLSFIFSGVPLSAQKNAPPAAKPPLATPAQKGRNPIIIIPGLTGSELINARTGEEVWFKAGRSKDDDIRLPISPVLSRNRDGLVTRDIIRTVKLFSFLPETEIYERLTDALTTRGGYHEAKWNTATRADEHDSFFVFPYDWRRDNVESARLLIRQIEALKRRIGRPNLKFNVLAHSMGGLVARYAAMYGAADLPATGTIKPTWAGAKHFNKIFLLGTPNEGSILSINGLLNGFSYVGGGLNLPFIQNITRFDLFTLPSIFELLPHDGSLVAYDEDLKPFKIDIYDPAIWEKYNWAVWQDPEFTKKMSPVEQRNAKPYFFAALARAKRFQQALDANTSEKVPIQFYLIGADCKETPSALVLVRNEKKDRWETRFKADGFTNSRGEKVTSEQLKPLIFTMGDSVVPKSSLGTATLISEGRKTVLPVVTQLFQCEGHSKLVTNPEIQDKLFVLLQDGAVSKGN